MPARLSDATIKLNLGSGPHPLSGWLNIDLTPYPGVDRVLDVTKSLPFENVSFIFAEHFIEHLQVEDALSFLKECRRVLSPSGVMRLSTPNLDWVWRTQYHPDHWPSDGEAITDCFSLNRGFYGWGHQFLYNRQVLSSMLRDAGFAKITFCEYGNSEHPELQNIERHEKSLDSPDLPHVLIVEASGVGPSGNVLRDLVPEYRRHTDLRWHMAQYLLLSAVRFVKRLLRAR